MKLSNSVRIIDIMSNTLSYVEPRLINHGLRVAYIVNKMLSNRGYSGELLKNLTTIGLLHDIGAYKTQEIERMVYVDEGTVWDHCIYGYLYMKYFSPLQDLAPIVLFHHAKCCDLPKFHPSYHDFVQIVHLADRIDILVQNHCNMEQIDNYLNSTLGKSFHKPIIDLFRSCALHFCEPDFDFRSDEEFMRYSENVSFNEDEIEAYLKMIVYSIDFRSRQTVTHTIATTRISEVLADIFGLNAKTRENIRIGAMLHDVGKTGTPLEILESRGRLSYEEMEVMKKHIDMTDDILAGSVDRCIRQIAVRHHEKLNGTGYPKGLLAEDLTLSERIVGVADILSALCGSRTYKEPYPKEKVVSIITSMKQEGLIDPAVVDIAIIHYERILSEVETASAPAIQTYEEISREYESLREYISNDTEELLIPTKLSV